MGGGEFHRQTIVIYKFAFNPNYYMFTLTLFPKIVLEVNLFHVSLQMRGVSIRNGGCEDGHEDGHGAGREAGHEVRFNRHADRD